MLEKNYGPEKIKNNLIRFKTLRLILGYFTGNSLEGRRENRTYKLALKIYF